MAGTIRLLADRLQPQQWLNPSSINWQDWRDFASESMNEEGV